MHDPIYRKGDSSALSIFNNFPLIAALSSIVLAQFVKVPLYLISSKSLNIRLGFSTGGMPSSHSAAVSSLTTAIGISEGLASSLFAISVVVSAITMYDAAGIRRHAGMHASFLNRLAKTLPSMNQQEPNRMELKELLGHRPIEVFAGAVFGIVISFLLKFAFFA
jgi:acid phosphatase family membrane protein YuiD